MQDSVVSSSKVAILTGSTSGLGEALALQLLRDSWSVIGVARSNPVNSHPAGRTSSYAHIRGDVADPNTVAAAFEAAVSRGSPTLLINCAGVGVFGAAGSQSSDHVAAALSGNLIGTILFCERAINLFKETGGTIVNVMSTAALLGRPKESLYCAAKWGARGYSEAIRAELKGSLVRVVSVYPGGMKTGFWKRAINPIADGESFMSPDAVAKYILQNLPPSEGAYVSDLYINRP